MGLDATLNRDIDLAVGTLYFLTADTVWLVFTKIFPWNTEGVAGIFYNLSYCIGWT